MDPAMIKNLHLVKDLAALSQNALEKESDLKEFMRLMDVHWQNKKQRSSNMSNQTINDWYDAAMANGALGWGKIDRCRQRRWISYVLFRRTRSGFARQCASAVWYEILGFPLRLLKERKVVIQ